MNWLKKILRFRNFVKILTIATLTALLLAYLSPYIHPKTFKILPFFGLIYPVTMLFLLVILLFWAIAKSKWFFVVLFFILIGGKLHFRTLVVNFSSPEKIDSNETFKVMSYNVRLFDVYNENTEERNKTRDSIVSYINNSNPDIICFQEFFHQDKPSTFSTRDTLIDLLKINSYHERYSHRIRNRQNFGICLMSKFPIIAKGDVMFPNFEHSDNYCLFVDIVKGKDTFRVYNVHLQSIKLQQEDYELFGEKNKQASSKKSTIRLLFEKLTIAYPVRADQAKMVVEHMNSSPYPIIVCGDFNDTPMSYVYNQFNNKLIDAFRATSSGIGKTYAGKVPAGRIDYIFYSDKFLSQNYKIQEKAFSDHLAIECEISLLK